MVPVYVQYMGAEAYGLVGFFTMLQAWFQLLDIGLTPTMARATARYNGGAIDQRSLRQLLRALEGIFVGVAFVGSIAILVGANKIAAEWLQVQHLAVSEVREAIVLMGFIVALRWVSGLYRGVISGFEKMVWLSGFNIAMATARFVLIIPVFLFVGSEPAHFFSYQLLLAVLELSILIYKAYSSLPKGVQENGARWSWGPLRGVLKFSLSIAFTSSVWILITQTDKLVLSKLLPLADYAYFTLAVLVAGGVMALSGPISSALLPRLTRMAAINDDVGLTKLYRGATQLVGVATIPASLVLALFSEQVLWAWTGDIAIARAAGPVLQLYALGNGILTLAAFPYYLQYAKGDMRLHLIGNAVFIIMLIPALIWGTAKYGVIGAGYAWLISNFLYFILWVPKVHNRFYKGLHFNWLTSDVTKPILVTSLAALAIRSIVEWPQDRALMAVSLVVIGIFLLLTTAVTSKQIRARLVSSSRALLLKKY